MLIQHEHRRVGLEAEIGDYWNGRATSYSNGVRGELADERHVAWKAVLERAIRGCLLEAYVEDRALRVLDLGCGPGFFGIVFAELGCIVDGVDASSKMLARARSNIVAAGYGDCVTLHESDVSTLPFEDGAFDVVACRNLTWLMLDPEAAYAEWLRVLRPGGKLLVFDANWYRYLVDPQIDAARRADQEGAVLEGWDEDAQATSDEEKRCEEIAAELPATPLLRPAWDLDVLPRLGASQVHADEAIWKELWTESEQVYYASSPMFLVEAIK